MPNGDGTGPFGDGPLYGKCYGFGRRSVQNFRRGPGRGFRDAEYTGRWHGRGGSGRGIGRGFGRGFGAMYRWQEKEDTEINTEKNQEDSRIDRLEKLIQEVLKRLKDIKD